MESRAPCDRALAPSRNLASLPVLTGPLPTRHPPMGSSVPCARAVAASRSLAPPPVLTGPCQSATLSDGEQSAMRQGLGAFQEPGSQYPYSQDPCQRATLSDGEQCALCEGRGCFQESGPPTRAHGPLPTRHPL
ncbi:hypothetical protein NDU88_006845 [Pleurodeles waltl]|uniref:Uncharacterized protein n=1 Tax=Pleurodeles waltl TaxID=8319 RepID=A0AAV7LW23_PLEWA|nr:hypothetical protein NDU88_006845 [Pleurodeles waltl]